MAVAPDHPPDPLRVSTQIVNQGGYPTPQFIRQWNQQRSVNVVVDDIVTDLTALEAQVDTNTDDIADIQDVDIVAGTGLDGGGNISGPTDVTIDLADTAVIPGTYGDGDNIPQITVDQQGRITSATEVAFSAFPGYLVTGAEGPGPEFVSNGAGLPVLLE